MGMNNRVELSKSHVAIGVAVIVVLALGLSFAAGMLVFRTGNTASSEQPAEGAASASPVPQDVEFTAEAVKSTVDAHLASAGRECYEGWKVVNDSVQTCSFLAQLGLYAVVTDPTIEEMKSYLIHTGDIHNDPNPEDGAVAIWNSSTGVVVPRSESAILEQFKESCSQNDQCMTMVSGDDDYEIVGLR